VDFFAELTLVQKTANGNDNLRHIRFWSLEKGSDGAEQNRSIFTYPPDVKGYARLTHLRDNSPDEHWVFVPGDNRVKRVSPTTQLSYFMGTQFTFEDFRLYRAEQVDRYTYKYLKNEMYGGMECYKIARFPTGKDFTNYSRHIMWIDTKEFRVLRVDFYDKNDALLKTMTRSKFELYEGRFWCMHEMEMVNHQTGEKTLVIWSNYQFGTGLKESDFTRESLKRLR
jgi:outer membrane lipoprotein-sorting protein